MRAACRCWVVGAEGGGADAEGAFEVGAGGGEVAEGLVDLAEVVGVGGDIGVVPAVHRFVNAQSALGVLKRGAIIAKNPKRVAQIVGADGHLSVLWPPDSLRKDQRPTVNH